MERKLQDLIHIMGVGKEITLFSFYFCGILGSNEMSLESFVDDLDAH